MAQTKYKIGEFSRLGRVTVRTLRHYEKIGFSLAEITELYENDTHYPDIRALEAKIRT